MSIADLQKLTMMAAAIGNTSSFMLGPLPRSPITQEEPEQRKKVIKDRSKTKAARKQNRKRK